MFLNIITPCTRVKNLYKIALSLQSIPKNNRRWIVVFDIPAIPDHLPIEGEYYRFQKEGSIVGNAQRNYALDIVGSGYIYFNDDDTVIHEELWNVINPLSNDFISFMQKEKNGGLRLKGDIIKLNYIDSHNFIFSHTLLGDTRFIEDRYNADGVFAEEIYKKTVNPIYIPKILSTYNSLR